MQTIDLDHPLSSQNSLLASLGDHEQAILAPHLEPVILAGGTIVCRSSAPLASICFPETLVASISEIFDDGTRYDVGLIGPEGLIGWPILLGTEHSPHRATVQLSGGTALAIPAETLVALCAEHRSLHTALLGFVQSFTVQMARTLAANLRDGIDRRLARWLLMLHDRVAGDTLEVTHVELAASLHVRRASVTDMLHLLEGERMLRCTRGLLVIRDRAALRALAGDSYGAAETTYSRLIAPFGKG